MLNATKAWAQQFDNKTCLQQQRLHPGDTLLASAFYTWAAWYNTWLLIKLTAQGVVFSFLQRFTLLQTAAQAGAVK